MLAVFGNEAETRWDAPVCHPEHCPSPGLQVHEAHPAWSTVMVEIHSQLMGGKGRFWKCWGISCPWFPMLPHGETLPAVLLSFGQG